MSTPQTVRFQGRDEPVIGERFVRGRRYLLLERLNSRPNETYRVFDRQACPGGDYRALSVLPASRATEQRIGVIKKLGERGPHFPRLVDFAREQGSAIAVFTWVHGENLRAFLDDSKRRPPRPSPYEASRVIARLAHGLAQFHGKRLLVHGDIKPDNLVLARDPLRLVLVDFGSAWPVERTLRRDRGDGATAPYAAPEQLADVGLIDWRADIFALCVVWYELLTLAIPYDGLGGMAGLTDYRPQFAEKLIEPSKCARDAEQVPRAVWQRIDDAICRGLALDANRRYASPREWLDALDGIQRELRAPVTLSPPNRRILGWLERLVLRDKDHRAED